MAGKGAPREAHPPPPEAAPWSSDEEDDDVTGNDKTKGRQSKNSSNISNNAKTNIAAAKGHPTSNSNSKSSSSATPASGLGAFFQSSTNMNLPARNAVDWEERSRGAYSTVSKMKSALERMQEGGGGSSRAVARSTNPKTKHPPSSLRQPPPSKAKGFMGSLSKSKSDEGPDRLGSFFGQLLKQQKHTGRTPPDADDRSRGAYSTMSATLNKKRRARRAAAAASTKPDVSASATSTASHADTRRMAAERTVVPTGKHPATTSSSSTSGEASNNLVVAPAASHSHPTNHPPSSSRKQKNLALFMQQQTPREAEDLEVRSAFTSIDKARKRRAAVAPPPLPTSKEDLINLLRKGPSKNTLTAENVASLEKTPATTLPVSQKMELSSVKLQTMGNQIFHQESRSPTKKPSVKPPKRAANNKPKKGLASEQSAPPPRLKKAESFRHQKQPPSPMKQFSSLLDTRSGLNKPQPIRSQSVRNITSGTTTTTTTAQEPILEKKPLSKPTPHRAQALRQEMEGVNSTMRRPSSVKKQRPPQHPSKGSSTSKPATNAQMSARRLHHAPASAIHQSPVAGRRQSLKVGEAPRKKQSVKRKKNEIAKPALAPTEPPEPTASRPPHHRVQPVPPITHDDSTRHRSNRVPPAMQSSEGLSASAPLGTSDPRRAPTQPTRRKSSEDGPIQQQHAARRSQRGRQPHKSASGEVLNLVDMERQKLRQQEESDDDDDYEPQLEDIFSFYTWSSARQSERNIQKERKVLRDSIMDEGPLHRAYKRIATE
jgi:hypothetical protein